jgi:hypothetical protein
MPKSVSNDTLVGVILTFNDNIWHNAPVNSKNWWHNLPHRFKALQNEHYNKNFIIGGIVFAK